MLWQRLLFGALMILAMVVLVVFDAWLSLPASGPPQAPPARATPSDEAATASSHQPQNGGRPGPWTGLPVAMLAVLLVAFGTLEAAVLLRSAGLSPPTAWSVFVAAGLCLIPWVDMMQQTIGLRPLLSPGINQLPLTLLWLAGGVLGCCCIVLARPTTERAFSNMAAGVFLFTYLGLLTSFVVRIRSLDPGPAGSTLFIYFVLTVKMSDIGAYFTGMAFGRYRLAPVISPRKTVEGFVGACLLAGLAAVTGWFLMGSSGDPTAIQEVGEVGQAGRAGFVGLVPMSSRWLIQAFFFGILMAVMGQFGDLVESAWKRDLGAKDSAQVVPSFGGVLDIIDSPVLAAPVAWAWFTVVLGMG